MSRSSFLVVAVFICIVFIAHVQSRNLALTGGISSLFNSPFRVIGKRDPFYTAYRQMSYNSHRIPSLSLDRYDY